MKFTHLISFLLNAALIPLTLTDDNLSKEDEEAGIELWNEYCPLAKSNPEDVYCDTRVGKIYYFKPNTGISIDPRELCRTKFRFNQQADMVSIRSCAEYKLFKQIVEKFIEENKKGNNIRPNEKITIYTSGYNSPVLQKNGTNIKFVSKWMSSPRESESLLDGEDEKCLNIDQLNTSIDNPLHLLTVQTRLGPKIDIVSKFVKWPYPSYPTTEDLKSKTFILCELYVPSKIQAPTLPITEVPIKEETSPTSEQTVSTLAPDILKTTIIPEKSNESKNDSVLAFLEEVESEINSNLPNVSAIEITEKIVHNMTSENFVLNKPEHLVSVIDFTQSLDTKLEKEIEGQENTITQRKNFTAKVLNIFSQVLKTRNDNVWKKFNRTEKVKNCVEIINFTEKLGFKLACGINESEKIVIDTEEIGLEAFSLVNANISSLVYPSNISSLYARTSHVLFPEGVDASLYSKQFELDCHHPAALGSIHKKLGSKLTPRKSSEKIASEMIAFSFGSAIENIKVDVVLSHKEMKRRGDKMTCVFWDSFNLSWNSSGCWLDERSSSLHHTVCHCNHLTNFAILMDVSGRQKDNIGKSILTTVGLTSSTICLIATIFFLFAVPALKSRRTTITANICVCLLAVNFLVMFGIERTENEFACRIISGFLLYCLAALFSWMLLEGYFLYQMIIVVFKGSGYLQVKWLYLIGYGLAVIWLGVTVSVLGFEGLYHPSSYNCWISNPLYPERIWAFIGPIILIIIFNTIIFAKSLHVACMSSMRKNTIGKSVGDKSQKNSLLRWFKGWISLIVLLGLTWISGFLYFDRSLEFFSYLFIILNSFQGVFIFLFEIVTNSKARPAVAKIITDRFTFTSDYLKSSRTQSTNPYSLTSSRNGRSTNSSDNNKKEISYISNRKNPSSFEMS